MLKKMICVFAALISAGAVAAGMVKAAEERYFGYDIDGNTLTVMENWEFDKADYRDKLLVLVYDGDNLIKASPAQPGEVANEHMATIPDGIENMKIKAAYVNDMGGIEIEAVPHYVDAVVDYTVTTKDDVTIYFKEVTDDMPLRMRWKTDGSSEINMTISGNAAEYTELFEEDVLSIACPPTRENLDNMSCYDIKVSRNVIEDDLISADVESNVIVMPQRSFKTVLPEDDFRLLDVGTEYRMNLDVFGRVTYHMGMIGSYGTHGNVIGMYESEDAEQPIVRILDVTHKKPRIEEYECKTAAHADEFYNMATGTEEGYKGELTIKDIYENIKSGTTFCKYKLTNGKIKFDKAQPPSGGEALLFNKDKCSLGTYHIDPEATLIVDVSGLLEGGSDIKTLDFDQLEDGKSYSGWLYYKNSDSVYFYAMIVNKR